MEWVSRARGRERERLGEKGREREGKKRPDFPFYTRLNPISPTEKSSHAVYTFSMGFLWANIKTID